MKTLFQREIHMLSMAYQVINPSNLKALPLQRCTVTQLLLSKVNDPLLMRIAFLQNISRCMVPHINDFTMTLWQIFFFSNGPNNIFIEKNLSQHDHAYKTVKTKHKKALALNRIWHLVCYTKCWFIQQEFNLFCCNKFAIWAITVANNLTII